MKICIYNFNGILDSLVNFVGMSGDLVSDWREADVVVMWQDVLGNQKEVAEQARMAGKKVYTVEHGLLSINDYIPPLSRPFISHKLLVWGQKTKEWLLEKSNIPEDKIVVTGTTIFDVFKPKRIHEGRNVLFAPRHWTPDIPENKKIAEQLKKLNWYMDTNGEEEVKVYSKIVEGEHDPEIYPNPISTNRLQGSHLTRTYDALSEADVLVTVGEGTISALAYYLDIPVISINEWEEKELLGKVYTKENFYQQVSDAVIWTSVKNLNKTIARVLKNPSENREKRLKFLRDYCDYDSDKPALQKQLEVIYGK